MTNAVMVQTGGVTVTQSVKDEWSRMATDAYKNDVNYIGHRYSMAAAIPNNSMLVCSAFDALQSNYRKWLIDGIEQFREAV